MQVHANLHKSECMALNKMCSAILVPINWRRSKNFNTCSSRGSSIKCNPITCLHHNKSKSYIQNPETQNNKFETKLSRSARDCCAILGIWESRRASLQAVTSKWHNLSSLTKWIRVLPGENWFSAIKTAKARPKRFVLPVFDTSRAKNENPLYKGHPEGVMWRGQRGWYLTLSSCLSNNISYIWALKWSWDDLWGLDEKYWSDDGQTEGWTDGQNFSL